MFAMKNLYTMVLTDMREELRNPLSFGLAFVLPFALFLDFIHRVLAYNGHYLFWDFVILTYSFYFFCLYKSKKLLFKAILILMIILNYIVFIYLASVLPFRALKDGLWLFAFIEFVAIITISYFQFKNIKRQWRA